MRIYIPLLTLLLSACSALPGAAPSTPTPPPAGPLTILCTTAYRSSVTVGIEAEQSARITPENTTAEHAYANLTWRAAYMDGEGFEATSLMVSVSPAGSDEVLTTVLFQLPRETALVNQFISHGFTGLNYIYHPETQAELQYWCEVE